MSHFTTGPRFTERFFARSSLDVAPDLIGAYLVRTLDGGQRLVARIVEVEAYRGDGSDPSAHSHRGPTPRNRVMFGAPGSLYVYRSYGIHSCANVVCEPPDHGAAVLFRAVEPVSGGDAMRARRGLPDGTTLHEISNGPGKLCQALDIRLDHDGASLLRGAIELRSQAAGDPPADVAVSPRIGISEGALLPWRFYDRASPWVSRGRPGVAPAQKRRRSGDSATK